jgi:hypothetical protein
MEQRLNSIEEELKVLKSQIKAVLLDIKESLATGINYAPPVEGNKPVAASPVGSEIGPAPDTPSEEPQAGLAGTDSRDRTAEQAQPDLPKRAQPLEVDNTILRSGSESGVADLLTVSVLAQWVSRASAAIGKDQVGKLVEIYDVTGHLPPRLKDATLLLVDLCGGTDAAKEASATEFVPAAVSVQLLGELDSVLRSRNSALESMVFSLFADKGEGSKKDGYG